MIAGQITPKKNYHRYAANEKPDSQLIDGVMFLWRRGENTADIAKRWCLPEHVVWRLVITSREALRRDV